MNEQPTNPADIFGPVIYSYTRAQAVADGLQVEVTKTAAEAGIRFPVFITRAVFDSFVTVPPADPPRRARARFPFSRPSPDASPTQSRQPPAHRQTLTPPPATWPR